LLFWEEKLGNKSRFVNFDDSVSFEIVEKPENGFLSWKNVELRTGSEPTIASYSAGVAVG
jgi:hypothetical protein